jgi:serine phosphatase RsbU (regulator of sigma subunit)/tetratricopeptide (TPR) repeat protein
MLKRFPLALLICIFSGPLFSQIDSLKKYARSCSKDTAKAAAYLKIARSYYNTEGILDSSLAYYEKAAAIFSKSELTAKYAKALNGKALILREKGMYKDALENALQALSLAESVKDTTQITSSLNQIAIVNAIQKDYDKAYEYYKKCEIIHLKTNNKAGLASTYNNMGLLFSEKKEPDRSHAYFRKALQLNEENHDERGIATACENIGLHFLNYEADPEKALEHFRRSIAIWRSMKDANSVAITLDYIVTAKLQQKKYKECLDSANLSLKLATEAGSISSVKQAHEKLYMIYEALNDVPNAYAHYKRFISMRDSLDNDEQLREITEMQMNYEFDKQREVDKLKQELDQKVLSDEISRQNSIILYFLIGLIVVTVCAVLIWRSYRINKSARKKIAFQNILLEEQNKNIVDSIKYAKHIQEAILPPADLMRTLLPEHFVVYKPKDIVSGDFYWVKEKDGKLYLAVVDCTGHGVPGAFMSIVGRNGLNEALSTLQDPTSAQILDFLNAYVNDTLNQTFEHSTIRDGMDIALCIIDKKKNTIQYSGANNPMWIIRSSPVVDEKQALSLFGADKRGIEYKADKQPVGNFVGDVSHPFSYAETKLLKGDMIYLFSDGFSDQFGGPKKKKFKRSRLKELFYNIASYSFKRQKQIIENAFEEWKGEIEQIDDICILGIKI